MIAAAQLVLSCTVAGYAAAAILYGIAGEWRQSAISALFAAANAAIFLWR